MLRLATHFDAEAICNIYNYYIENTVITFEEERLSAAQMLEKMKEVMCDYPWVVQEENNLITGYAYATKWKMRSAYRHTAECSVYLDHNKFGKGTGTLLYTELIKRLKEQKLHSLLGGIALPNEISQHLHAKLGFERVGRLNQVGYKFGKWVDVEYWELILE